MVTKNAKIYPMKRAYLLFSLLITFAIQASFATNINGFWELEKSIYPDSIEVIYWDVLARSEETVKTVRTDNGNFSFSLKKKGLYKLVASRNNEIWFVIDHINDEISLRQSDQQLSVTGSHATQELNKYETFRKQSFAQWVKPVRAQITAATKAKDTEKVQELSLLEHDNYNLHLRELMDYSFAEMSPSLAHYYVALRWVGDDYIAQLKELVSYLKSHHKELELVYRMENKVLQLEKTALGNSAPPFLINNESKVDYTQNTLTLIEFWGSWCGPCRRANPHLVQLYKKFNNQGFEIVAFAIERRESRMKNAMAADGILWPSYTDEKMYQSEMVTEFNVSAVPSNFLINSEGKIIAKNLHWKSLEKALKDQFSH